MRFCTFFGDHPWSISRLAWKWRRRCLSFGVVGTAQGDSLVQQANRGVVALVTAGDAASITMAQDMASVVDDRATRRLLRSGMAPSRVLIDREALHGIDMTIAQVDVLDYAKKHQTPPDIATATYIAKLHSEGAACAGARRHRTSDGSRKNSSAGGASWPAGSPYATRKRTALRPVPTPVTSSQTH